MTFSTVIEIIVAVFAVFGFYSVCKMFSYLIAYEKSVRSSIRIAVEISEKDDLQMRELKKMCARQISLDTLGHSNYITIEKFKE